ncbi:hypothetical protein Tco_1133474 [Tanacetum coccineum]
MDNNHASFVPPPIKSLIWFPFKNQGIGFNNGTHVCVLISRIPGPSQALARRYEDILQLSQVFPKRSTGDPFRFPQGNHATLTTTLYQCQQQQKADEMNYNITIQVSLADHKSSPPRHDETSIPGTRLEPRSDKESPKVEIVQEKEEETIKAMEVEPDIVYNLGRYGYLFAHLKKRFQAHVTSSDQLADNLLDAMMETLPSLVKEKVTEQVKKEVPVQVRDQVPVYLEKGLILERKTTKEETERLISKAILQERGMKFEKTQVPHTACRPSAVRTRDQDDPYDDAHLEGGNSPSTSGNQEQDDEFDFWTESYASDNDEIPTKQVSQDIMEEISLTTDEPKLKKMVDEMLRQRCTSGDEHHYHIDQMKNFLQSDIVWESRKEILVSPHLRKITPLVQRCQRDPEAPALSLINQDLLYLKKGNSGHEKIILSLHKFPAIVFNDDDIEERTSR